MAGKRRRSGKSGAGRQRLRPSVWLATVSAVVGVATGMFTLRDKIFPEEAGTAVALPAYQGRVGGICTAIDDEERRRARALRVAVRETERATTTADQRDALASAQRETTARSGRLLAQFEGLETPKRLEPIRRSTEGAWKRNLARLRDYVVRLDHVTGRAELLAALDHLSGIGPKLSEDGVTLMSGLSRLGGADCDLADPVSTRTFTLTVPAGERENRRGVRASKSTLGTVGGVSAHSSGAPARVRPTTGGGGLTGGSVLPHVAATDEDQG